VGLPAVTPVIKTNTEIFSSPACLDEPLPLQADKKAGLIIKPINKYVVIFFILTSEENSMLFSPALQGIVKPIKFPA